MRLTFTAPLDAAALHDYFVRRAVPGIEWIDPRGETYVRSLRLVHGPGVVAITLGAAIDVELALADPRDEAEAIAGCRTLLDLDADPQAVTAALGADRLLGASVHASPGRRVPGAIDATELCVRAILGQQISLAGAATAAGRLVQRCGEPLPDRLAGADGAVTHVFPTAEALAVLDPETLAMPRARARTLVTVAAALARRELVLQRDGDATRAREQLLALPGIGPWTADYVVMRVLGDHDVFLATDLGVRRALARAGLPADPRAAATLAERWRPYRSYALQYLWAL